MRVQPFLRKIFEGINGLEFQKNMDVTAMISEEGEKVRVVCVCFGGGLNVGRVQIACSGARLPLFLPSAPVTHTYTCTSC